MFISLDQNFTALCEYLRTEKPSKLFILCDENTHEYCLPKLLPNLETDIPFEIIEIEAGEEMKTIETAVQLWEILTELGADRQSLLINVGGGVITDMGGFVASTFKRGIRFVNLPTTLLAMCDASIGGKTGIDHGFLKNIVGTFALPERIFINPDFLQTLDFVQIRSGFAEMLKHGLIADEKHWLELINNEKLTIEAIAPHITQSMAIKQRIVDADFKEKNVRKTLNFGHTIGHSVESLFLKQGTIIPHGECVAMGMICETQLAFAENLLCEDTCKNIIHHLEKFYPKLEISPLSNEEIMSVMQNDKKNSNGNISFSLITKIGNCNFDYQANSENITAILDFYRNKK